MRKEMLEALEGKSLIKKAEWFEENDPEMLDWVTGSKYCDFERGEAVVEVQFSKSGVEYYACDKQADCDTPSQNQPPWGEDEIENWLEVDEEYIRKYYDEITSSNIFDALTISEAAEIADRAVSTLRRNFERGKSFERGVDCRKAGGTWLVTREAIEREYA